MDTRTLSFSVALVGSALVAATVILAIFRKERGLWIYAASFLCAAVGFLLFLWQDSVPRVLSVVLANALVVFYHLGLSWGLRSRFRVRQAWPLRFGAYMSVWLAMLLAMTWGRDFFTARSVALSVFISIGAAEFLVSLRRVPRALSTTIRRSARIVVLIFIPLHAARIGLILTCPHVGARLMDNSFVNAFTFAFTLFFSILWAAMVLIIDSADLMAELESKSRTFREQATTDELTGFLNRRSFESAVAYEMERSDRYHQPLSIIMFDIDRFKVVNDTWGHQTGDTVLKRIASITNRHIREPDNLFRWGGEEFIILAPHTSLSGAAVMAEKLREAIASEEFIGVGTVTASFGVSEWRAKESLEEWLKQVDQAMYRAKNTGRDRVVCFGDKDAMPIARISLEWRSEWSSGNHTIDEQHRKLLEISNNLLDLSLSGAAAHEISVRLDEALGHVVSHFADEEAVLAELGYPDLDMHTQLHRRLVEETQSLKASFEAGACGTSALFNFLVGTVVVDHLLSADRLFFGYTRKAAESCLSR